MQLDRDLRIKVADLGLSEEVAEDAFSQTDKRVGTLRWIAPEMLAKNCKSMEKADVYSYGIVLFELGCGLRFLTCATPVQLGSLSYGRVKYRINTLQ
jgi:serine/threonine protein kinase